MNEFEKLVAYVSGDLDAAGAAEVERELAASDGAVGDVAFLRELIATMRSDDAAAPPSGAVERVVAAFARRASDPSAAPAAASPPALDRGFGAFVRQVIADLVLDTRLRPAVAGFRGAASDYQLAYESELGRVDLQVTEVPAEPGPARRVRGQVTPRDRALPPLIRLIDAETGETASACAPDERGRFRMTSRTGVYDLVVGFDEPADAMVVRRFEVD